MVNVLFNTFDGARKYIKTIFIKDNKMEHNAKVAFQIIYWAVIINYKGLKELYYFVKELK